jgi:exonuclease III
MSNVNYLRIPVKRQRVAKWIKKHDQTTCCLGETHCKYSTLGKLKVKHEKNISLILMKGQ